MKKILLINDCTIPAGIVIELTEKQFSDRKHLLSETSFSQIYLTNSPVFFKKGETIKLDSHSSLKSLNESNFKLLDLDNKDLEKQEQTKVVIEERKETRGRKKKAKK